MPPVKPGAKPAAAKSSPFGKPSADDVMEYVIEEGSDGLIPDGEYEVKCVGVRPMVSEAGNNMFVWDFVITKGQHAGNDYPIFTALTQAAMWKLTETLEALGFDTTPGQKNKFTKKEAMGRMAIATIIKEIAKKGKRKGKPQMTITNLAQHPKGAGYKPAGTTGNPFLDKQAQDRTEEEEENQDENVTPEENEELDPEMEGEVDPDAEPEEDPDAEPEADPEEDPEEEPEPDPDDDDEVPVVAPSRAGGKIAQNAGAAATRRAPPPPPPAPRKNPPAPPRRAR
jgi:hypothetical protein